MKTLATVRYVPSLECGGSWGSSVNGNKWRKGWPKAAISNAVAEVAVANTWENIDTGEQHANFGIG